MRRICPHRPTGKVRGIPRRLRAIDRWAESFDGFFPIVSNGQPYWNHKIPVLSNLVGPPKTTPTIQAHCASAMLRAANHILNARTDENAEARVTVLITFPHMFGSELCVFFDQGYFTSFFDRTGEWQSLTPLEGEPLSRKLDFSVPEFFMERGYVHRTKDEWEGEVTFFEEEWWSYCAEKIR